MHGGEFGEGRAGEILAEKIGADDWVDGWKEGKKNLRGTVHNKSYKSFAFLN